MSYAQMHLGSLGGVIKQAKEKLGVDQDGLIARYIPDGTDGYGMHHFTFGKMVKKHPRALEEAISTHILMVPSPKRLPLRPRAASSGVTLSECDSLSRAETEDLLRLLEDNGAGAVAAKLMKHLLPFSEIHRMFKASISRGEVNQELWEAYVARHPDNESASSSHSVRE